MATDHWRCPSIVERVVHETYADADDPILQVVGLRQEESGGILMALGDDRWWVKARGAPQIVRLLYSKAIRDGTRLRLLEYQIRPSEDPQPSRALYICRADVLETVAVGQTPPREYKVPFDTGRPGDSSLSPRSSNQRGVSCSQPVVGNPPAHAADLHFLSQPSPNTRLYGREGYERAEVASPLNEGSYAASPPQVHTSERLQTPAAPHKPPPTSRHSTAQRQGVSREEGWPRTNSTAAGGAPTSTGRALRSLHFPDADPTERAQQPPDLQSATGPVSPRSARDRTMPIAGLNPWSRRWRIKARVSWRTEIRSWQKNGRAGRLFNVGLTDKDGAEIKAVAFDLEADRLFAQLQPESVVIVSEGAIKPYRGQYEITFDQNTAVEQCTGETMQPTIHYEFKSIAAVEGLPVGSTVDVAAVVEQVSVAATVPTKHGTNQRKRSLSLRDDTLCSIELTLWGAAADKIGSELEQMLARVGEAKPILAVKAARLTEWFGPTLSSSDTQTRFEIDSPHPKAEMLRNWETSVGSRLEADRFRNLSRGAGRPLADAQRVTIAEAASAQVDEKATLLLSVNAAISYLDQDCVYPACTRFVSAQVTQDGTRQSQPQPGSPQQKRCNKKLRQDTDGFYFCEACGDRSEPQWRYRLLINLQDHTGQLECTAFEEAGAQLMGMEASRLWQLQNTAATEEAAKQLCEKQFGKQLTARLKASIHTWNNFTEMKFILQNLWPVDFKAESKQLLEAVSKVRDTRTS